jgi:2-keto-4-pentenoate hydratase
MSSGTHPDNATAESLARRFVAARRDRTPLPLASLSGEVRSADEAYRIQDAVARELGWFADARPAAWKTGAPDRVSIPIAAPIPRALMRASPAVFAAQEFHRIGIEAEIALRFRDSVDASQAAAPGFDWTRVVGEILVGIEIVDSRIDDAALAPALLKLADFQQNGAYVIGTGRRCTGAPDWARQRSRVQRNGAVVAETRGGHPLGDPTCLLPWFVRHVEARGAKVCAGDLVTLGTWAGIVPAAPGERIDVEFAGIGHARVEFS